MPLTRAEISAIAHSDHPVACPLFESTVEMLVEKLALAPGARVLDIGCGPGVWLDFVTRGRRVDAAGVDLAAPSLQMAKARLEGRGAALIEQDARSFLDAGPPAFDAILCNGSSHALGGFQPMLAAIRNALVPGGKALVSDGFWTVPPTPKALAALDGTEDEFPDLAGLKHRAEAAGFAIETCHVSTAEEWDDYEESWCGALERHADEQAMSDADRKTIRETAASHRAAYEDGYRDVLGFAALILRAV